MAFSLFLLKQSWATRNELSLGSIVIAILQTEMIRAIDILTMHNPLICILRILRSIGVWIPTIVQRHNSA